MVVPVWKHTIVYDHFPGVDEVIRPRFTWFNDDLHRKPHRNITVPDGSTRHPGRPTADDPVQREDYLVTPEGKIIGIRECLMMRSS